MNTSEIVNIFEKSVKNRFSVYNSLFLNLPFHKIGDIGILIPLLQNVCRDGLEAGHNPIEILDEFFCMHTDIQSEKEKIDFMFRVIQYVERQVVLYDSIEDAAFKQLLEFGKNITLKDYFNMMICDANADGIPKKLRDFCVRIVFTAHPTQFYSPSVLEIISNLQSLIQGNDINKIEIIIQQLGFTSLINAKKPTPLDEAKNIIYLLRNVYYDAAGALYADIKKNIQCDFDNPNIIQLGFWPGGDRDGNPFVTAETTKNVADELRMSLMKCYYNDIKKLEKQLTFRQVEDIVDNLKKQLYISMFSPEKNISYEEIIKKLNRIKKHLLNNYNRLYLEELDSLIDKVRIFKTHFATIDIRQNHSIHEQAIYEILKAEGLIVNSLDELDENQLADILLQKSVDVSTIDFNDKVVSDTILTISQLAYIQEKNGEDGCNRYIISNSEDLFSVLFVYALLKWCCWKNREIPFDIIPLFESMEGMKNAGHIMRRLFEIPVYRSHIASRSNIQTIMLGFSDGTKDGGYLQANWSIFKTKEALSEICGQYGIKAIFFDGRGGPPARGGGKTHSFYASHTRKIANHAIQLTIQGQTITSKFGTKAHFIHNCEQLLTAGVANSIYKQHRLIPEHSRQLIEKMAVLSFEKYNSLKNHALFIPYLENKSTLKYYGEANIASRPIKRGKQKKLSFKDLRAIPFVGSWSQLKQNVPGYFGIGTAIRNLVDDGKTEALKQLFKDVPFFRALIQNSMMSLSKCNFNLTGYMAADDEYGAFWDILFQEYNLSKEMVLLISGYDVLMAEEPVTKNSIEIREQIVLPLLVVQQYALQKTEKKMEYHELYEKIVKRSLYGNINASRNSA